MIDANFLVGKLKEALDKHCDGSDIETFFTEGGNWDGIESGGFSFYFKAYKRRGSSIFVVFQAKAENASYLVGIEGDYDSWYGDRLYLKTAGFVSEREVIEYEYDFI